MTLEHSHSRRQPRLLARVGLRLTAAFVAVATAATHLAAQQSDTTGSAVSREGAVDTLVVHDTGQGIERDFLPNVFDAFRQADASSTRQHGGLGLGLSIARQLVQLHGGTITASSDGRNRGATFTVRLPVREPELAAAAGSEPARVHGSGRLRGVAVLVVDDERDTLEMLQSVLNAAGARVLVADSADEALRIALAERPAAIVSDIGMPDADGYALMEQIVERLGAQAPRARIALTAYAGDRDRVRSKAAGFQRHLAKPIDPLSLVEIIAGALV